MVLDRLEVRRHRDGGRDAAARRPRAEPRGPGDGATSPSTSRASPPASGPPTPRSPARSAPASTSSPTRRCRPAGRSTVHQLQLSGNGLSIFTAGELRGPGLHRAQRGAGRRPRDLLRHRRPRRSAARSTCAPTAASPRSAAASTSTFDGGATDLALGDAAARPAARRRDHGSPAARCATRPASAPRTCSIANPQLTFASNGQISSKRDRHRLRGQRSPTSRSSTRGSAGALTATGHASGDGRPITVTRRGGDPAGRADGPHADRRPRRLRRRGRRRRRHRQPSAAAAALDGLVLSLAGDVALGRASSRSVSGPRARWSARTG